MRHSYRHHGTRKQPQRPQSTQSISVRKPIDEPTDTPFDEPFHVEIDQQADFALGHPAVQEHLRFVNAKNSVNRLHFDDPRVFNDNIHSI